MFWRLKKEPKAIYKLEANGDTKLFVQGITKNDTKIKEFSSPKEKSKYIEENFQKM